MAHNSNYTILRPQSREAWLKLRRDGIGSSEVGTILGVNPYDTPYQLWRRKLGIDPPKPENSAMKAGHFLEDAVSRFWSDATGRQVIKRSAGDWIIRDNDKPFMQVSPDRTYWLDQGRGPHNKGILECKTTRLKIYNDSIPDYWFAQLQYQLGVAGYTSGSLAWLRGVDNFGYQDFRFAPEFYELIKEEVTRFWVDNVCARREPRPINVTDVALMFPSHTAGKAIQADDSLSSAVTQLKALRERLDQLDQEKKTLEATIKSAMADAELLRSPDGNLLATWRTGNATEKFDEKRFAADHPELYASYRCSHTGSRRFILK